MYGSYFTTVIGNSSYMLINKYKVFYGFQSKASCWYPSIVTNFYYNYNPIKKGSFCYEDSPDKWQYSVICRPWFILQNNTTACIYYINILIIYLDGAFPELYAFASNQKYGMTICSPIMDNDEFTGAFCSDLLPTLNYGNVKSDIVDNYLWNMYLSYLS
jgi:hypothetical protein